MTRVLVASYGTEPDDFAFTLPGELAVVGMQLDCPAECGCSRAWAGLGSMRPTTVVLVAEKPDIDRDGLIDMVQAAMPDLLPDEAAELADDAIDIASAYDVGTRLRHDGEEVTVDTPARPRRFSRPRRGRRRR